LFAQWFSFNLDAGFEKAMMPVGSRTHFTGIAPSPLFFTIGIVSSRSFSMSNLGSQGEQSPFPSESGRANLFAHLNGCEERWRVSINLERGPV
jgi:hypothetical protein